MLEKTKIIAFFKKNKIALIILLIVIIISGFFIYKNVSAEEVVTKYVLAKVEKGTISSSISGSGQVSTSNQLDVKPKVSADVISVAVVAGQEVKEGQVLATLNASDALKSVRSAQISLESAKLSLEKSQRGYRDEELLNDRLNLASLEDDLSKAKVDAELAIKESYSDANALIQDSYNKVDDILNKQLEDLFISGRSDHPAISFLNYDSQAEVYAESGRLASTAGLKKLKDLVYNPATDANQINKNLDVVQEQLEIIQKFLNDLTDVVNAGIVSMEMSESELASYKSAVSSARTSINSQITTFKGQKQDIIDQAKNSQDSIDSAQKSLTQAQNSYNLKIAGSDPLDLRALEITVRQRFNDLFEAQKDLADYTVRAPFDGVVASVGVKPKEPASGSSVVATIITKQKIAEVSLNEIDAAKAEAGQKAMLTFDAVEDLEISGTVVEVDSIGTVSQGVVSYNAKIAFDTQDERIKPGMSVSASIITNIKQNVLLVSNSAIKTQNSQSYIEKFENEISDDVAYTQGVEATLEPIAQIVEVGISNDSYTEIVSGLSEGEQIIVKKTTSNGSSKSSAGNSSNSGSAPNIMQSLGGNTRTNSEMMPPR